MLKTINQLHIRILCLSLISYLLSFWQVNSKIVLVNMSVQFMGFCFCILRFAFCHQILKPYSEELSCDFFLTWLCEFKGSSVNVKKTYTNTVISQFLLWIVSKIYLEQGRH